MLPKLLGSCLLMPQQHTPTSFFAAKPPPKKSYFPCNKPGPAQVGAISKAQNSKRTSKFQSILFYSTKFFFEKSLTTPKKFERGDPLGFSIPSLSQNPEKLKGDPLGKFFFRKKVSQCRKKLKGGPFGLVRHCMLCGKLFGSVPWANR